jgi:hypothetical protein
MENDVTKNIVVGEKLRGQLNRHGHSFHYAVLQRAEDLANDTRSHWVFEASEFPVRVGGFDTRIDFILRRRGGSHYLVAECKRANPATANWCFVRAPLVSRNVSGNSVIVETSVHTGDRHLWSGGRRLCSSDIYHLGFEVKTGEKGDEGGPARTQIEEAAGQVLKGVNGFVEFLSQHSTLLTENTDTPIIPVIFTTANLWVSDVRLNEAELSTGNLPTESVKTRSKDWLWYQYHLSPGLRHSQFGLDRSSSISDALTHEFARCIAIVSPSGIDEFLREDW